MRPLQAKFGKILPMDQKDQRRRSVWVGQADFSKIAQRKQKFIKRVSCTVLLRKAFYQCLHKKLALLCGFMCDSKTNPKKFGSADFFRSFRPTKK